MPTIHAGDRQYQGGHFAIVVARYNHSITQKLLDGAIETLTANGVPDQEIEVAWVPGAWEVPVVVQRFAKQGRFSAILCLAAVIRGETTHDQYINRQVSENLGRLALDYQIPVLFGVLTCNTLEQAIHRAGGNVGNKGIECAVAALEMVNLMRQCDGGEA